MNHLAPFLLTELLLPSLLASAPAIVALFSDHVRVDPGSTGPMLAIIASAGWVLYLFAAFLLFTGYNMIRHRNDRGVLAVLDPRLKTMWAGYAFSKDFREERGHAYMLVDQTFTERQQVTKQPGTCMQCHASVYTVYKKLGDGDLIKGFEALNPLPYAEALPAILAALDDRERKVALPAGATTIELTFRSAPYETATVPISAVYDQFSGGRADPGAIARVCHRWEGVGGDGRTVGHGGAPGARGTCAGPVPSRRTMTAWRNRSRLSDDTGGDVPLAVVPAASEGEQGSAGLVKVQGRLVGLIRRY